MRHITAFLDQSPDGLLHMPPALDTIVSSGTAINTTLAATTINAGDSFTIKNQSSDPVQLSDFAANCNCMGLFRQAPSGLAPLESALLEAGEELVVSARFAAPDERRMITSWRSSS